MQTDYWCDHKGSEHTSPVFLQRLRDLNGLVVESGSVLEGNLFYMHKEEGFLDKPPNPLRIVKRRNFFRAVRYKRQMLEVGVNAGHSALLALSANPSLVFHGVDFSKRPYTGPCVAMLKEMFPSRVHFHEGDSREVLPHLVSHAPELAFDLFHVDGGHGTGNCIADVTNCLQLARRQKGAHLLLDDTNVESIFDIYCQYVALGYLVTETLGGTHEGRDNLLARIFVD